MCCEDMFICDMIFDNYLQGMGEKKRVTLVLNGTPQGEIKLLTNVGNGKAMECNFI